jgi:hypothetical protein
MATGYNGMTLRDYDNEVGRVRVRQETLTAANFDAQAALRGAFESAVVTMTECAALASFSYGNEQTNSIVGAASTYAQRELKWLVQYHESGGTTPYSMTIPCAKTTLLDPNDKKHAHIGDAGVVDAFVTAFEAFVLGPNGSATVVDDITLVGRNV